MNRVVAVGLLTAVLALGLALLIGSESSQPENAAPADVLRTTPLAVPPSVRVNVSPVGKNAPTIAIDGPFVIRVMKTGHVLYRGRELAASTVKSSPRGMVVGRIHLSESNVEVVPEKSPGIWVGRHQYRGTLRLHGKNDGKIVAVNVVPMDAYLASVVNGEMPASFSDEARKAQVVVARSYALYRMSETRGFGLFDVYADARSQRYLGFQYRDETRRRLAGETAGGRKLVRETAGLICTYRGKLFSPYYSAVCGGKTVAGRHVFKDAAGCLKSVPCRWCRNAKRYRWKARAEYSTVNARLRKYFADRKLPFGNLRTMRPAFQFSAAKPAEYIIGDGTKQYQLSPSQIRTALPTGLLASSRFTARLVGRELHVEGRGHGHGVGLCQWGAAGQAKEGRAWRKILGYYYPGSRIAAMKAQ